MNDIMHTFTGTKGTRFHYNPDMSGGVTIISSENVVTETGITTPTIEVSGIDILEFVAEFVRMQKIAQIEDMTMSELLGDI